MGTKDRERYDDNKFYESEHGPARDWTKEPVEWIRNEPSPPNRATVASYDYKRYLAHYAEAESERTLLQIQRPRLNEQDFLEAKKRLVDLFTIPEDSKRVEVKLGELVDRLLLNPYQRYGYEEYIRRYEAAKQWGRVAAFEQQLSQAEFLETKGRLLRAQRRLRQVEQSYDILAEEENLRRRLFPPVAS